MKQVVRRGLKNILVEELPAPELTAHHVVIRPECSLISSGTETASIHQEGVVRQVIERPSHLRTIWKAALGNGPIRALDEVRAKFSEYAILGYAGAGIVVEAHPTVPALAVGDRVAYGGEGTGHGELVLAASNLTARVPATVPFDHACFATLGSIALNAARISELEIGDVVVVLGLGLVGQLAAQMAHVRGARVIAADVRPERVELARQLGSEHALIVDDGLESAVKTLTGGLGADCVIVAASAKSAAPAVQALQLCRDRGRIVVLGAVELSFPWIDMYRKEIRLLMSRAYGPGSYDSSYEQQGRDYPLPYVRWTEHRNMEEVLRLLEVGRLRVEPLITHRFALAEAPAAYEAIMAPGSQSLAVLLRYPPAVDSPPRSLGARRVATGATTRRSVGPRVALIGAGNIARWAHLPALRKHSRASLHAVCSANGARAKSYALRFGASYCSSSYDEILADDAVDAVLIASRNTRHAEQALAALQAGKHVFVEKPMALTAQECRLLVNAVRESGKQLAVGFNRRFAPFYLAQHNLLARRVGPAVINCRVNSPGIAGSYWMADPASGGAILGEACHFVDLMFWLLGAEPVSVCAASLPTGRAEPIGENNLAVTFRFADGSVGNLTYCTVGSATSGGERVEAFAPGLGVRVENFQQIVVEGRMRRTSRSLFPHKGYDEQMASFLSAIDERRPPEVTVDDGTRATIVCLRTLEAASSSAVKVIDWRAAID